MPHSPTDKPNHEPSTDFRLDDVVVRAASENDHDALCELFTESVHEGLVGENDTGADIENLQEGYFCDEGQSAFWVATHEEVIIGMIGVQKTKDNTAEIRRLRVRNSYRRRGVGGRLMKEAITFCQHHSYLKVVLDVRTERGPAIALFEKFGFSLSRTRDISGRKLLDFYLDLYRDPNT